MTQYFDFKGRARRKEYWYYSLCVFLMLFPTFIIAITLSTENYFLLIVAIVLGLFHIIPNIAVSVRRLHDQNISGWVYLVSLIPYVGGIIVLVLMCLEGTKGENKYGEDPKELENNT